MMSKPNALDELTEELAEAFAEIERLKARVSVLDELPSLRQKVAELERRLDDAQRIIGELDSRTVGLMRFGGGAFG